MTDDTRTAQASQRPIKILQLQAAIREMEGMAAKTAEFPELEERRSTLIVLGKTLLDVLVELERLRNDIERS